MIPISDDKILLGSTEIVLKSLDKLIYVEEVPNVARIGQIIAGLACYTSVVISINWADALLVGRLIIILFTEEICITADMQGSSKILT